MPPFRQFLTFLIERFERKQQKVFKHFFCLSSDRHPDRRQISSFPDQNTSFWCHSKFRCWLTVRFYRKLNSKRIWLGNLKRFLATYSILVIWIFSHIFSLETTFWLMLWPSDVEWILTHNNTLLCGNFSGNHHYAFILILWVWKWLQQNMNHLVTDF